MDSGKDNIEPKKGIFQSLTPEILKEGKAEQYLEALRFSVDHLQIKNIALTGSYGAGKSSVLLTFENKYEKNYDYLRISLAAFNKEENIKGKVVPEKNEEDLERLLEVSILQQIFYHVKHEDIPDSRFKRILNLDKWNQMQFSAGVVGWMLAVWYLFFPNLASLTFSNRIISGVLDFSMLILFSSGIFLLVQHLRRVYNNSKVNKMNIHSGEFEVDKDVDRSVLNKHLDELIYFFEVTKFNVVIIEDLDRFDSVEIFSKLREINLLLNNSLQIGRKITFIYAVRDNMFSDESRTKFFDFVIPIIPATDPSNAGNILIESFKNAKVKAPSDIFLREVSAFISDMRFLRNVFNEYIIYFRSLDGENLIPEKIFGMMLYKNFYPDDFMELQRGKGKLHNVIHTKKKHIEEKIAASDNEIEREEEKINLLRKGISRDEGELRAIYIHFIQQNNPNAVGIFFNNSFFTFAQLHSEDIFEKFRKAKIIHFHTGNLGAHHMSMHKVQGQLFQDYEKIYDPEISFDERLDGLEEKKEIKKCQDKIASLKVVKQNARNLSLAQLLKIVDLQTYFKDVKHLPLINYLLKQGYIDESYHHYISKFVVGTLTFEENEFKKAVLGDTQMDFDYSLINVSNLVKELEPRYFDCDTVLNFNLVDYLFQFNNSFPDRFHYLKKKLQRYEDRTEKFLDEYIEKGTLKGLILKNLIDGWPEILETINRKEDKEKGDKFTRALLEHVDNGVLDKSFPSNEFDSFIEEKKNFMTLVRGINLEKVKSLLRGRDVYFQKLEKPKKEDLDLFKFIVDDNHYYLTIENIRLILETLCNDKTYSETFKTHPFTTITKCDITSLKKNIEKNWDYFIKYFILDREAIEEEEEIMVTLLNDERIDIEDRKKIISKMSGRIGDLNKIKEEELGEELLLKSKVLAQWSVLEPYYLQKGKTDSLMVFLDAAENYHSLSADFPREGETKFAMAVVDFNELSIEAYKNLVSNVSSKFGGYCGNSVENLDQNKVEFLVKNGILVLCDSNFDNLKEHFPGLEIILVEVNQKDLSKRFSNFSFDQKDLESIIASDAISKKVKLDIIPHFLKAIERLPSPLEIPDEYLMDFVLSKEDNEKKIEFFNLYKEKFEEKKIRDVINSLKGNYSNILRGGQITIDFNKETKEFSEHLANLGLVKNVLKKDKIILKGKGVWKKRESIKGNTQKKN